MAVVNASTMHETDRYRMKSAIQNFDLMFKLGIFSDAAIAALAGGGSNPPATAQGLITLIQNAMSDSAPTIPPQYIPNGRSAIEAVIELVQYQILGGTMSDTTLIAANHGSYSALRTAILGNLPTTDPVNFSTANGIPSTFKGGETYTGNHRSLSANALPPSTLG